MLNCVLCQSLTLSKYFVEEQVWTTPPPHPPNENVIGYILAIYCIHTNLKGRAVGRGIINVKAKTDKVTLEQKEI